jgi:uncharacterized protein (TIGR03067 family)
MAPSNQDEFDGYRKWLNITSPRRPPTHYETLGIKLDEDDHEVIQAAIEQRRNYVESKRGKDHDALVAEILMRIDEAGITLLNNEMRRDYDRQLNLFEKRRKNRQVDPNAPRSRVRSQSGRTVGEDGGIVKTFVGIMAVVCIGFGGMAWLSFQLPWFKKSKEVEVSPAPVQQPVMAQLVQPPVQVPVAQAPMQPPQVVTEAPAKLVEQEKPKEATAETKKAIQGVWVCVANEQGGNGGFSDEVLKKEDRRITIKGESFTMLRTRGTRGGYEGKFEIDATNGHFEFTGTPVGGGKFIYWFGVYELSGDTLKLSYRQKNNDQATRPTEFKTTGEDQANPWVCGTYQKIIANDQSDAIKFPKPVLQLTFDTTQTPGVRAELQGATFVKGRIGKALQFDGRSYAIVNHNVPIGNSPRSLAVWLKNTRGPVNDRLFHVVTQGPVNTGTVFGIMEAGGKWRFFDFNGGLDSGIQVDTAWHHHCVTFDGTKIVYFFDGKAVSEVNRSLNTTVSPLFLGTMTADDKEKRYKGLIDELMIYDVPLTQNQIAELIKRDESENAEAK